MEIGCKMNNQKEFNFPGPHSPNPEISGKEYISNYITTEEAKNLRKRIDEETWLDDLKRRVQHYGYKYDYKARRIGELPDWGSELAKRFGLKANFHANQTNLS